MKSHIVKLTGIICFTAIASTAIAQELQEKKGGIKPPKLLLGANLGITAAALAPTYPRSNYFKGSGGLFARYYFGRHMAVEGGFNYSRENNRINNYTYTDNGINYEINQKTNVTTYAVPLQLQYHLLPQDSKIRPYFGLGLGILRTDYNTHQLMYENGVPNNQNYAGSSTTGFASFTQGITWQINKRWQINQSLTISKGFNDYYNRNKVDFRIGIGYNLFK